MKNLTVLSMFLAGVFYAGSAHATLAAPFTYDPTTKLSTTGTYAWPYANQNNTNGYAREVSWTFNTSNPYFATSNPNASYYRKLGTITAPSGESFTYTGSGNGYFSSGTFINDIGTDSKSSGNKSAGTAVYTFNGLSLENTSKMLYLWAEITVKTSGGNVSFSNLTNVSTSEIFQNGTLQTATSHGNTTIDSAINYAMTSTTTGTPTIYDAYFSILNPTSTEALSLAFNDGNGANNYAVVSNFKIAMTPEPMSMALFATGVAVLFFRRRRVFQLV